MDSGKGFRGNILLAFLVKGGSALVGFLTAPAILRYFGDAGVLGIWYTLVSALLLLLNFDLGLGNGLRSQLTRYFSTGDWTAAEKSLSTGLLAYAGITALLALLGGSMIPALNWNRLFGVAEAVICPQVLRQALGWVLAGILLRFFLLTVAAVLNALQMSAVNNLLALCASVLQLVFLNCGKPGDPEEALLRLSRGYALLSNLPAGAAGLFLLLAGKRLCRPALRKAEMACLRPIVGIGSPFFVCQMAYMVLLNTNEMLISACFGPQYTTEYTFYYKLATLSTMVAAPALTPVWSSVAKATATGDHLWVSALYRRLKLAGGLAVLGQFAFVLIQQRVMDLWLGPGHVTVDFGTALMFACFGGAFTYGIMLSTVVSGLGRLRLQMICYCAGAVAKLLLVPYLGHWRLVAACNAAALGVYCILQQRDLDRCLREKEGKY